MLSCHCVSDIGVHVFGGGDLLFGEASAGIITGALDLSGVEAAGSRVVQEEVPHYCRAFCTCVEDGVVEQIACVLIEDSVGFVDDAL